MTPLAASISDTTIWSFTFDDTRSVDYDRNSFIIQATGVVMLSVIELSVVMLSVVVLSVVVLVSLCLVSLCLALLC